MEKTNLQLGSAVCITDEKHMLGFTQTVDDNKDLNSLLNTQEMKYDEKYFHQIKSVKIETKINSCYEKSKNNNHIAPKKNYDQLQKQKDAVKILIKQKKEEIHELRKQQKDEIDEMLKRRS